MISRATMWCHWARCRYIQITFSPNRCYRDKNKKELLNPEEVGGKLLLVENSSVLPVREKDAYFGSIYGGWWFIWTRVRVKVSRHDWIALFSVLIALTCSLLMSLDKYAPMTQRYLMNVVASNNNSLVLSFKALRIHFVYLVEIYCKLSNNHTMS